MYTHNPHLNFLNAAENIAQLYRDDRKKNIFCTFAPNPPISFSNYERPYWKESEGRESRSRTKYLNLSCLGLI